MIKVVFRISDDSSSNEDTFEFGLFQPNQIDDLVYLVKKYGVGIKGGDSCKFLDAQFYTEEKCFEIFIQSKKY